GVDREACALYKEALDELLAEHGGFNHNVQTLRTLDRLETRYADHPGLNLSYEVREGIARHESSGAEFDPWEFPQGVAPTLEAAIVDVADEIAYNSHDIDDGLASGLLALAELRENTICARALEQTRDEHPESDETLLRYGLVRKLVGWQIKDLVESIDHTLGREKIVSVESLRRYPGKVAVFSAAMGEELGQLRMFLNERLYRHPKVMAMARAGRETVTLVFRSFLEHPGRMPESYASRAGEDPPHAAVRDYVAGMTDRYAERLAHGITGKSPSPPDESP
ncbi:MAG: hypothetical protein ACE5GA_06190, partial [Candidatus Zixiibacteriota bacterium]